MFGFFFKRCSKKKQLFQVSQLSAELKPKINSNPSINYEKEDKSYSHSTSKTTHHWDYFPDNGINRWPQLCREGIRQSPINIRASDVDYTIMNELKFVNYNQSGTLFLSNNGHSILGNGFDQWPSLDRPYIYGGGLNEKYFLSQFHFHWSYTHDDGSEHTIGSLHYPVEAHFVHIKKGYTKDEIMNRPDGMAVLGVFMTLSNDATAFATLDAGIRKVTQKGNKTMIFNYSMGVNLPSNLENFYRYSGSLTTPGCNEAVIWTILAEPIGITEAQLNNLRQVRIGTSAELPDSNARPIQLLNGRRILYRSSSLSQEKLCQGCSEISKPKHSSATSKFWFSDFERTFLFSSVILSIYFLLKNNY